MLEIINNNVSKYFKRFYVVIAVFVVSIIILFILGCESTPSEPEEHLCLKIEPAMQTIGVDEVATFSVKVEDIHDLFSFSGEIVYDSSLVDFESASQGSFWNGHETIFEHIMEAGCINICVGLLQTDLEDGIDGTGTLFQFQLKSTQSGQSLINFENITLIKEDYQSIEDFDSIEDGELIIE